MGNRAELPIPFVLAGDFKKDFERLNKSGRYDMQELKRVMLMLIDGKQLPAEYKNHPLKGEWKDFFDCHIGGDFLLIYSTNKKAIVFARTGTHSEIFGR